MKSDGKTVRVVFTEPEHRLLRQAAARRGVPVRHYARGVLLSVVQSGQTESDREDGRIQPAPAPTDLGHHTGHG
jgi:hypothetical protein